MRILKKFLSERQKLPAQHNIFRHQTFNTQYIQQPAKSFLHVCAHKVCSGSGKAALAALLGGLKSPLQWYCGRICTRTAAFCVVLKRTPQHKNTPDCCTPHPSALRIAACWLRFLRRAAIIYMVCRELNRLPLTAMPQIFKSPAEQRTRRDVRPRPT